MKYFQLTFPDKQCKITVNDDHSFIPYQNYLDFSPLLSVTELTEEEFAGSELKDLTEQ